MDASLRGHDNGTLWDDEEMMQMLYSGLGSDMIHRSVDYSSLRVFFVI